MQAILDKRINDIRLYDVDCSNLLGSAEIITSCGAIQVDDDAQSLIAKNPIVNTAPVPYPQYNRTAAIGKVVQVKLVGGQIPDGADSVNVTLRLPLVTNINELVEATVVVRLINNAP